MFRWIKFLFSPGKSPTAFRRRARPTAPSRARLSVEGLESRLVPTVTWQAGCPDRPGRAAAVPGIRLVPEQLQLSGHLS